MATGDRTPTYLPKISIVIPAYNASNYLAEAIDSALAQTYTNTEIIVVNDGSKDDGATERTALAYGNKIRYFSKENGGSSSALNMGITNMTGEWFSWLSHDDLYTPEKLEKQVAYIHSLVIEEPELPKHIFFSASELIDADGKTIRSFQEKNEKALAAKVEQFPHNGHLIAEPTVYNFHGCSCLIHKDAFTEIGCFDEHLRLLNDMDLWFRLYAAGYHVHYIPEPLVKGRIHAKQVSKSIGYSYHNPEQDMFWNRSLDWLLEKYPEDKHLLFRFGRNAYLKTRNAEGDRAFENIRFSQFQKQIRKNMYCSCASLRNFAKTVYLKLKQR
ncbi:MAG: glycosyltransferase [Clostridia bacterium]|nr:glycosyltransferase [Clostridia bacterium]